MKNWRELKRISRTSYPIVRLKWMSGFLSNLGHKRGRDFWASYKSLLNKKKKEVGLIRNKSGEFRFTRKAKFVPNLKTTFFSGQHFSKQSFHEGFFEHSLNSECWAAVMKTKMIVDPLSLEELNAAIANTSNTLRLHQMSLISMTYTCQ